MEDFREVRDEGHSRKEDTFKRRISMEDSTEAEKEKRKSDHGKETWRCPDPNCKKINPKEAQNCGQCKLSSKLARAHDDRKRDRFGGDRGGKGGRGGRSGGGGRGGERGQRTVRRIPNDVDATNPVVVQFVEYSHVLDDRHDRYERIVKLGKDITIDAKRIIFALHRIKTEKDKPCVLGEAEMRLGAVKKNLWREVAFELKDADDWEFLRGYSSGLQEYVEALSLYHYLCYDKVISWEAVQEELKFRVRARKKKWEGTGRKNEVKEGGDVGEKRVVEEGMVKAVDGEDENRNHLENATKELPVGPRYRGKRKRSKGKGKKSEQNHGKDQVQEEEKMGHEGEKRKAVGDDIEKQNHAEGAKNGHSADNEDVSKESEVKYERKESDETVDIVKDKTSDEHEQSESKIENAEETTISTQDSKIVELNDKDDGKKVQVIVKETDAIIQDVTSTVVDKEVDLFIQAKKEKTEQNSISTATSKVVKPINFKELWKTLHVNVQETDSIIVDKIEKTEENPLSAEASKIDEPTENKLNFTAKEAESFIQNKIEKTEETPLSTEASKIAEPTENKNEKANIPAEASKIDESTENKDTDKKNLKVSVEKATSIIQDKMEKDEETPNSTEASKMVETKENKLQVIVKEADSMILDKIEKNEKPPISTEASKTNTAIETKAGDEYETLMVTVPQTDYILGLADLTGELMRNAINSVAVGNTEACFSLLALLQQMTEGFAKIDKVLLPRHVERKLEEFNRSLRKVEDACYAINVRGSELPKDHLGSVFETKADDGYHSHARDPIEELYFGE